MRDDRWSLMKLATAACLISVFIWCGHARVAPPAVTTRSRLFRICVGDKFGYIDPSGTVAIAPTYAFAEDFEEDRAIAWAIPREPASDFDRANPQNLGRGGFIARGGRFVVPPIYEHVGPLRDGLAVVGIEGRYGYIDREGQVRLPLQFRIAENFSEGLAYVEDDAGRRYIDTAGNTVIDMTRVKWSAKGVETVVTGAGPFSEGLAVIRYYTPGVYGAEGWGFLDRTGRIVVEPRFRYAYGMREGVAHVSVPSEGGAPGGDAIIDRSGRYIIPPGRGALGVPDHGRVRFSAGPPSAGRVHRSVQPPSPAPPSAATDRWRSARRPFPSGRQARALTTSGPSVSLRRSDPSAAQT